MDKELKMPLYYRRDKDSKEFIKDLEEHLKPIINKFLEKGYTMEEINHSISFYCLDTELTEYLRQ